MKIFFLTVLLLISQFLFCQSVENKASILQKEGICKMEAYTTEGSGKRFLSQQERYDSSGRIISSISYDRFGEVIFKSVSEYQGDSLEISKYTEDDKTDTAIIRYDKNGRISTEYWYWGKENDSEESIYYYKENSDTLICRKDIYSWGDYYDSLFYSDGLLIKVETYNDTPEKEREERYKYQGKNLVRKEYYNFLTESVETRENYTYYPEERSEKIIVEDFVSDKKENRTIIRNSIGIKQEETILFYDNSDYSGELKCLYNEKGLLISCENKYPSGDVERTEFNYFKGDNCP